jgi:sigma-B regulation protein RsbU (phosphoserine phosphatase)
MVVGAADSSPVMIILGPSVETALYSTELLEDLRNLMSPLDLHLRNIFLLAGVAHEKQLLTELEVARSIQNRLMPRTVPCLPGLEFAGRMITSSEVGGDYYDFLQLSDNQIGLALGDATGHGIPAALLISSVALAFHSHAAGGKPPERVLGDMNRSLCAMVDDADGRGTFAGFVYARYDAINFTLHYCNGGMPPPWVLRADGRIERLSRGGTLLGAKSNSRYRRGTLRLRPGDLLFIRSDGVEDQINGEEEPFGDARLLNWLETHRNGDLEKVADSLIETLQSFSAGGMSDDISFVFMRLNA